MNYPKPYFSDIPGVGCLDIDYIFFEAECPILFTCIDLEENLYLCICCDIRDEQRWIISPTTADKLIKLIKNKTFPGLNLLCRNYNCKNGGPPIKESASSSCVAAYNWQEAVHSCLCWF